MIRARAGQDALAYLERIDPDGAQRMRDRMPQESWTVLSTARKSEWIPLEHDHHLSDGWIPVFGRERAIELIAGSVLDVFETPVLKPLIQGAIRLLGATPASLIKIIPRASTQIYRNFHDIRIGDRRDGFTELHFEEIHPQVLAHPSYFFVWRGTFEAIFRLCRCEGRAQLDVDEAKRRAKWTLQWTERGAN